MSKSNEFLIEKLKNSVKSIVLEKLYNNLKIENYEHYIAKEKENENNKKRLYKLKEKAALTGINTKPEIEIEIEDIEKKIIFIDNQLKKYIDSPQLLLACIADLEEKCLKEFSVPFVYKNIIYIGIIASPGYIQCVIVELIDMFIICNKSKLPRLLTQFYKPVDSLLKNHYMGIFDEVLKEENLTKNQIEKYDSIERDISLYSRLLGEIGQIVTKHKTRNKIVTGSIEKWRLLKE
jgi:hypothetical protein